ncbi:complex I NDUFA9 subunit family protein [Alkalilimnicola ehrlichii]|uniref:complex I NDUFA9 subunit family protein n=1 Tax=Alkalilimnicola ehrlichii TaxID=351052 RepID=UPI003BA00A35
MAKHTICILGGSGFIGTTIAGRLGRDGHRVIVPTRHRERSRHLLPVPNVEVVELNVNDEDALVEAFQECTAVINLVGILNELSGPKGEEFRRAHVELPRRVISACQRAGVGRYLHMSALGADPEGPSLYQQTKGEGERLAIAAHGDGLSVTAFRPSVVFGSGDRFFNRFAGLLRLSPGFMFLPTPHAEFQPVWVNDVASAFICCLEDQATGGQVYDLVGPKRYTLEALVRYTARIAGIRRHIVPLSDGMSRLNARLLGLLPGKPYSLDNYLSATVPNVSDDNGLPKLGIHPTAVEAVVPTFLGPHEKNNRYQSLRREARR